MAPLNRFARTGQGEGRVFFFVNKKEAKKTLVPLGPCRIKRPCPKLTKVFWLLFFKKVTAFFHIPNSVSPG
jgi:hypothetical protein